MRYRNTNTDDELDAEGALAARLDALDNWQRVDERTDMEREADEQADAARAQGAPPKGNASLEAWQDYARSLGVPDDVLDGMSRGQLRDEYSITD